MLKQFIFSILFKSHMTELIENVGGIKPETVISKASCSLIVFFVEKLISSIKVN